MITLPTAFLARMQRQLGADFDAFVASYDRPAEKAVRVNELKISTAEFEKIAPFALSPVPWEQCGFYITEEKPGRTLAFHQGLFYVQEPSAMCAAPLLDVQEGERVLDLCSAPGGKGTQMAQKMHGKGIVVLNEIVFSRAKILSSNVERMGIQNAVVTCASPAELAKNFPAYFDKILVDAPCSGEGMFKKEPNAIPEWSEQNVDLCAERQIEILACAHQMLKSNGKIVYSTCTFAPQEDEQQVEAFVQEFGYALLKQTKIYPHEHRGEGHFAALLQKPEGEGSKELKPYRVQIKDKKAVEEYKKFEKSVLSVTFQNITMVGENLYSLPDDCPALTVQTLRAGVHLGDFTKGRFTPSHSLAMCLNQSEVQTLEVTAEQAESYLNGQTINCAENLSGWHVVTHGGYPLGWCKISGGMAKNHYPKGLRTLSAKL